MPIPSPEFNKKNKPTNLNNLRSKKQKVEKPPALTPNSGKIPDNPPVNFMSDFMDSIKVKNTIADPAVLASGVLKILDQKNSANLSELHDLNLNKASDNQVAADALNKVLNFRDIKSHDNKNKNTFYTAKVGTANPGEVLEINKFGYDKVRDKCFMSCTKTDPEGWRSTATVDLPSDFFSGKLGGIVLSKVVTIEDFDYKKPPQNGQYLNKTNLPPENPDQDFIADSRYIVGLLNNFHQHIEKLETNINRPSLRFKFNDDRGETNNVIISVGQILSQKSQLLKMTDLPKELRQQLNSVIDFAELYNAYFLLEDATAKNQLKLTTLNPALLAGFENYKNGNPTPEILTMLKLLHKYRDKNTNQNAGKMVYSNQKYLKSQDPKVLERKNNEQKFLTSLKAAEEKLTLEPDASMLNIKEAETFLNELENHDLTITNPKMLERIDQLKYKLQFFITVESEMKSEIARLIDEETTFGVAGIIYNFHKLSGDLKEWKNYMSILDKMETLYSKIELPKIIDGDTFYYYLYHSLYKLSAKSMTYQIKN